MITRNDIDQLLSDPNTLAAEREALEWLRGQAGSAPLVHGTSKMRVSRLNTGMSANPPRFTPFQKGSQILFCPASFDVDANASPSLW